MSIENEVVIPEQSRPGQVEYQVERRRWWVLLVYAGISSIAVAQLIPNYSMQEVSERLDISIDEYNFRMAFVPAFTLLTAFATIPLVRLLGVRGALMAFAVGLAIASGSCLASLRWAALFPQIGHPLQVSVYFTHVYAKYFFHIANLQLTTLIPRLWFADDERDFGVSCVAIVILIGLGIGLGLQSMLDLDTYASVGFLLAALHCVFVFTCVPDRPSTPPSSSAIVANADIKYSIWWKVDFTKVLVDQRFYIVGIPFVVVNAGLEVVMDFVGEVGAGFGCSGFCTTLLTSAGAVMSLVLLGAIGKILSSTKQYRFTMTLLFTVLTCVSSTASVLHSFGLQHRFQTVLCSVMMALLITMGTTLMDILGEVMCHQADDVTLLSAISIVNYPVKFLVAQAAAFATRTGGYTIGGVLLVYITGSAIIGLALFACRFTDSFVEAEGSEHAVGYSNVHYNNEMTSLVDCSDPWAPPRSHVSDKP